jgi:hypothetical protein
MRGKSRKEMVLPMTGIFQGQNAPEGFGEKGRFYWPECCGRFSSHSIAIRSSSASPAGNEHDGPDLPAGRGMLWGASVFPAHAHRLWDWHWRTREKTIQVANQRLGLASTAGLVFDSIILSWRPIKKCQVLDNAWLVRFWPAGDSLPVTGARAP